MDTWNTVTPNSTTSPSYVTLSQTATKVTTKPGKPTTTEVSTQSAKVSFSTTELVSKIAWFTGNLTPQNATSIKSDVKTGLGLANLPAYSSQLDNPTGNGTNGSAIALTVSASNPYQYTYTDTTKKGFDVLAIHFGQAEIVFQLAKAVSTFSLGVTFDPSTGKPLFGGLSNWRAYLDGPGKTPAPIPTPLPAALWMVSPALLGALRLARRKGKLVA